MNHPKNTALIAAFRNVETTVKALAADSAMSPERALNAVPGSAVRGEWPGAPQGRGSHPSLC
jgi:hypothetical protein